MTKRMIIMLLLVGLVFGAIFGLSYMGDKGMNDYMDNMPIPPAAISTTKVAPQTWQSQLEAPGSVTAVNGTTLTSEAGGLITAILFESGKKVKKGDLLVQLDSADARAELARLQAQSELSDLNRKRREKLYKLEAISKSDLDAAMSEYTASRASIDSQRARLAQKDIRAPFDGTVGIRQVNLGEYLPPGGPIATLQSLDPPEQRVGQVEPGFPVSVITEAFPDRAFKGEVLAIEPRVDPATRNFKVRARVPNPDLLLRPGQFGKVRLDLPVSQDVVVVPRTAIDYSAYGNAVFVVQKKKVDPNAKPAEPLPGAPPPTDLEVTQRFVKLGAVRGDFIAVIEGLKSGEEIATAGLLKLRNGAPVIINNDVTSKPVTEPKPPQG